MDVAVGVCPIYICKHPLDTAHLENLQNVCKELAGRKIKEVVYDFHIRFAHFFEKKVHTSVSFKSNMRSTPERAEMQC